MTRKEAIEILNDCDDTNTLAVELTNDIDAEITSDGLWFNGRWANEDELICYAELAQNL